MAVKICTASSLEKVFAAKGPKQLQSRGSMLKNEIYNFQFCCLVDEKDKLCRITAKGFSPLKIQIRKVTELPAHTPFKSQEMHDDYVLINDLQAVTLYPELLEEISPSGIIMRDGLWESFWISVKNLPAGEHEIELCLWDIKGGLLGSLSYFIEVIDADLPVQKLKYTCWIHYDSIAEQHNCKPFGNRFYKILDRYIEAAVSHGVNMIYTPLFTPPIDTAIGGERMTVQLIDVEKQSDKLNITPRNKNMDIFIYPFLVRGKPPRYLALRR